MSDAGESERLPERQTAPEGPPTADRNAELTVGSSADDAVSLAAAAVSPVGPAFCANAAADCGSDAADSVSPLSSVPSSMRASPHFTPPTPRTPLTTPTAEKAGWRLEVEELAAALQRSASRDAKAVEHALDDQQERMVATLVEMGFESGPAQAALERTEWCGLEPAMEWLLERNRNAGVGEVRASKVQSGTLATDHEMQQSSRPQQSEEVKMVIAVRTDLGMGRGKVAAQVAHAAVDLYRTLNNDRGRLSLLLREWESCGEPTIVVGVNGVDELIALVGLAGELRVPHSVVNDAGRTQVAVGTLTCAAFVGPKVVVDSVTGQLELL